MDFLVHIARLGELSLMRFWTPLLVWTVFTSIVLLLLRLFRDHAFVFHLDVRRALLLSLPLAFLVMPFAEITLPLGFQVIKRPP